MAQKIKSIKQKLANETYGDAIPLGADASNVDMKDGSNVQDTLENATKNITDAQNDIGKIKTDVSTNKTNINTLQNNVSEVQTDITDLQNDMSTVNTNVTDIQGFLKWKSLGE